MSLDTIPLDQLPGWDDDDLDAALAAYKASFQLLKAARPSLPEPGPLAARTYFQDNFVAVPVAGEDSSETGLFTGYFEPILKGSRQRQGCYQVPLLRCPPDLVTLVDDALRASAGALLTHARQLPEGGMGAYPTRQEIEQGCLDHMGLAFAYLADPVDTFFLHVQGSGLIELDDGTSIRVGYAAKNGHPYTSLGAELIRLGEIGADDMNLVRLADWLRADEARGRHFMWRNRSYIFFKEIGSAEAVRAVGVRDIPLTAGRSLAVDGRFHPIGSAVFVSVPGLIDPDRNAAPFNRLMVAQDAGSAIRGPVRGDIFYGTGRGAGVQAGLTRHRGQMFRLVPRHGGREL